MINILKVLDYDLIHDREELVYIFLNKFEKRIFIYDIDDFNLMIELFNDMRIDYNVDINKKIIDIVNKLLECVLDSSLDQIEIDEIDFEIDYKGDIESIVYQLESIVENILHDLIPQIRLNNEQGSKINEDLILESIDYLKLEESIFESYYEDMEDHYTYSNRSYSEPSDQQYVPSIDDIFSR